MKESRTLEFKETVTNTFLKTVSAFANFGAGEILFGVRDDGTACGVPFPDKMSLDIENRINDSLKPIPTYTMEVDEKTAVIRLSVQEGLHKPYLYKAKAYKRNGTATIEVDRLELTRLILEGEGLSFEELRSKRQDLSFSILSERLQAALHLNAVTEDTLKTLELYKEGEGYNQAGALLADKNDFFGIDIVRFGESINILRDRETYAGESILLQYEKAAALYQKYYKYEKISGTVRKIFSLVPEHAYREAVANALVHRAWDINAHISISMHENRIEIVSPGGLPQGMHEAEYYRGGLSILRNRILANVFFRLGLIEGFGTGIPRIQDAYGKGEKKPTFTVLENSIRIILPVLEAGADLSEDERKIYSLAVGRVVTSSVLVKHTGFGKSKVVKILNKLVEEGYIRTIGNGRGRKYAGV